MSDMNNKLKESFQREFNNAKKRIEAEEKQKPFRELKSTKLFLINVCLS